ncbi:MAG: FkbM family methyltransferase, partial [Candidatus Omnitrophica bacterium]|nr:FkbM family methyltransferase [Candidatus Omnitrophota bacterium]
MCIGKAIAITRRQGCRELVKRLGMRISFLYEKKHSPLTVSHLEAMRWFVRRKDRFERLITAVGHYIRKDSVIFDIGANIGYFSLLLTEKFPFSGSVYLFEPVPHLAQLCRITFRNSAFRAAVLNFGLSDQDADENIFIANDGNLGWNTLISSMTRPGMTKVPVKLKAFATCGVDVIPSFIKVDVEGAEYRVLGGMLDALRRWDPLPVILCEVGFGKNHPAWEEEIRVFMEMEHLGYRMCDLDGVPVDVQGLNETTDV